MLLKKQTTTAKILDKLNKVNMRKKVSQQPKTTSKISKTIQGTVKRKHIIHKPISANSSVQTIRRILSPPKLVNDKISNKHQSQWKKINRTQLINKLNYINFQDRTILITFKHRKYNRTISRHVYPQPCNKDRLDCLWTETKGLKQILKTYKVQNIIVTDKHKHLLAEPELLSINKQGICFKLPKTCYEAGVRKAQRHTCKNQKIQLIQNSALFFGKLKDFNPVSFRVSVAVAPPQTFQWIHPKQKVNLIIFAKDGRSLYSGECRILKQTGGQKSRNFILEPVNYQIQRFRPKVYRSPRQKLVPSPDIDFKHPLTGKTVSMKVVDISGSGFSVEEDNDKSVLLPGMLIPSMNLNFSGSFKLQCASQVVYRNENNVKNVKCGLAILDMNLEDHMKLLAILNQAEHGNSHVSNKINSDALWNFFFETGYIHPEKYSFVQENKNRIKNIYEKLYSINSGIARRFLFQDEKKIQGHMAMLRFYENTWLIHQHAIRQPMIKSGLAVLHQIARFTYDSHRLSSSHMNYLLNYYKSEDKFQNLVFRGITKKINNLKGCSIDTFAYFRFKTSTTCNAVMSGPWSLIKTQTDDLIELESYYERESSGLMVQAFDLEPGMINSFQLSKEYKKLGFQRGRYLLSLKKYDTLKAIILVNISDIGLNISNITNSINIIVLDPDDIPKNTLFLMLRHLAEQIMQKNLPVFLYPASYANEHAIPVEKLLDMWILDTHYSDQYLQHINHLIRSKPFKRI